VGSNELFPEWKQIKSAFPDAEDAFSSPSRDLLLVIVPGHLIVVPLRDGKLEKPAIVIDQSVKPVMVQWATGKYVDAWTKELEQYFHPYVPQSQQNLLDPKQLNIEGLKLMQQHNPESALRSFVEAARLDPSSAEFTNNAGFAYYQMGKYEESVLWLQKTVSSDPKRAVAYLNLGDAYAKLKRNAKARQAYTKYLELAPDSKSAPKVKKKLDALSPTT
jgi:tetratricopeptide (TPR) repeat protein